MSKQPIDLVYQNKKKTKDTHEIVIVLCNSKVFCDTKYNM